MREDGLKLRFERCVAVERWQDSSELYETLQVGPALRSFCVVLDEGGEHVSPGVRTQPQPQLQPQAQAVGAGVKVEGCVG